MGSAGEMNPNLAPHHLPACLGGFLGTLTGVPAGVAAAGLLTGMLGPADFAGLPDADAVLCFGMNVVLLAPLCGVLPGWLAGAGSRTTGRAVALGAVTGTVVTAACNAGLWAVMLHGLKVT